LRICKLHMNYCKQCRLRTIVPTRLLPVKLQEYRKTLINRPEYFGFMSNEEACKNIELKYKNKSLACRQYYIYENFNESTRQHVITIALTKPFFLESAFGHKCLIYVCQQGLFRVKTYEIGGYYYDMYFNCFKEAFEWAMAEVRKFHSLEIRKYGTNFRYPPLSKFVKFRKNDDNDNNNKIITYNKTYSPFSLRELSRFFIRHWCLYKEIDLFERVCPKQVEYILYQYEHRSTQ
jgi:hypothetical protein